MPQNHTKTGMFFGISFVTHVHEQVASSAEGDVRVQRSFGLCEVHGLGATAVIVS